MDPTAAFGLVCGIIQVIDFSTKVVKKCHELYRDGVLPEHKEAEEMASHLTDLRAKLDVSDGIVGKDLLDLGSKCSSTAQELVTELEKMKVDGPHRKRQVVRKTLKIMLKGSPIDRIQKRLDEYQQHLDSKILVDLRFVHHHSPPNSSVSTCTLPWDFNISSIRRHTLVCKWVSWRPGRKALGLAQASWILFRNH